ncbi:MAG: dihydrodipicolinate synthase family protein [Acidobacteriota bacterium]|nr:dihydrodipicolinate synthase family protein [Acidobacteriota bacterium]
MKRRLKGVFVALTTPFAAEDVSVSRFQDNIRDYNTLGLGGYVVLGSTGECLSLTDAESEALVKASVQARGEGKLIIGGTGRESTRLTVDFTNRMADAGADAALIRPPSYFKTLMTPEVLKMHYWTVADRVRVPVIIYNIPRNTGIAMDSGLVAGLAGHPNIIGLKDSSGDVSFIGETARRVPGDFCCLVGSGSVFLFGLELGATGAILAVANAAPEICLRIFQAFQERRLEDARKHQSELIPLNKAVTETYGIAGLKYAQQRRGYHGGEARSPLLPLDDKARADIDSLLLKLNLREKP